MRIKFNKKVLKLTIVSGDDFGFGFRVSGIGFSSFAN